MSLQSELNPNDEISVEVMQKFTARTIFYGTVLDDRKYPYTTALSVWDSDAMIRLGLWLQQHVHLGDWYAINNQPSSPNKISGWLRFARKNDQFLFEIACAEYIVNAAR